MPEFHGMGHTIKAGTVVFYYWVNYSNTGAQANFCLSGKTQKPFSTAPTVMQVTIHQIAGNRHFLVLYWPSLIAGNMFICTQIAGIPAIAGKLASLTHYVDILKLAQSFLCASLNNADTCIILPSIITNMLAYKAPLYNIVQKPQTSSWNPDQCLKEWTPNIGK